MRRILFADDERLIRECIVPLISERYDVQMDVAEDGQGIIDALERNGLDAYSLIMSDNQMPKLSGIEAIAESRMMGYEGNIVMQTNSKPSREISEGLRIGAVIEKPYGLDELFRVLDSYLPLKGEAYAIAN